MARRSTTALLAERGVNASPEDLLAALESALLELRPGPYPAPGREGLGLDEERALAQGGLDPCPRPLGERDPMVRFAAEHAAILSTALTVDAVAAHLGVSPARIRQRLTEPERSLLGVRDGREWRIPAVQLTDADELPGWAPVCAALPRDLPPVAVWRWLTAANADLEWDERAVSPREWLLGGGAPEAVVALAAGLV